jgi:hypothetical protein
MDEKHQGGTDDRDRLTGPCLICHLQLIRRGLLKVTGRAPNALDWQLGPTDIGMRVVGRTIVD